MKRRISTSQGIVKELVSITPSFKFIKLIPLSQGVVEEEIPVYGNLEGDYVGKYIIITSQRKGILGKDFEQTIVGKGSRVSIELPYSSVERANDLYRRLSNGNKKTSPSF